MQRSFPRSMAAVLLFTACATAPDRGLAVAPPAESIAWQRSLDDALAIAKADGRPLLLAVNMDGESASDRIYGELYRDPKFVALTRHCVCVPASVFRHNARDYDLRGRRIPCPRFGEITCGEHIALEPILWERYLNDGERVAPRHRLVRPDGTTAWDLSLCFDLQDIARALAASVGTEPLAARSVSEREHRQRLASDLRLPGASVAELRARLASTSPPIGVDGLLQILWQMRRDDAATRTLFLEAVRREGHAGPIARSASELINLGLLPVGPLLDVIAGLDDGSGAMQLAANALRALETGPLTFTDILMAIERVTASGERRPKGFPSGDDPLPEVEALDRELGEVEAALRRDSRSAELHARFAKASLDLARQWLAQGKRDSRLLFEDAELGWQRALARDRNQPTWWIERARTAYYREDTAGQLAAARQALALATASPLGTLPSGVRGLDAAAVEAMRWLGDAVARRLGQPEGRTVEAVHEGLVAHGLVAASPFANAKDHVSFASFCLLVACPHAAWYAAEAGCMRFPADVDLRGVLAQAVAAMGSPAAGPGSAARIEAAQPVADSAWFLGQAHVAVAEDARRRDDTAAAMAAYDAAAVAFTRCEARNPAYADGCLRQRAACAFGRAVALVRTADRNAALVEFERALAAHPASATTLRDGLGYDALDLVDRLLEWRDSGPSPVTATALHERLQRLAPGVAFWPAAVADAAIREALRADGRNLDKVERATVDAGGKPIRMPMGRATTLGDAWLVEARTIARLACAGPGEVPADATTALAQACVLWAERQRERGRDEGVVDALAEAARVLGVAPLPEGAGESTIAAGLADLRSRLGPARPKLREGR
jgi:tetratricopeptide (TPR) repeat protein